MWKTSEYDFFDFTGTQLEQVRGQVVPAASGGQSPPKGVASFAGAVTALKTVAPGQTLEMLLEEYRPGRGASAEREGGHSGLVCGKKNVY